jgi:sortase (surface protein transpeptidase)
MLRYDFRTGIKKQTRSRKLWVLLPFVALITGSYVVVNAYSPEMRFPTDGPQDVTAKKLTGTKPNLAQNRIYLPQINVDLAIQEESDQTTPTDALHRSTGVGNPSDGGNFIVAGSRFSMGITPVETRSGSPFYHIDQLAAGDQVYVDYHGVRYAYEVTKQYSASQSDDIVVPTSEARLTLYSYESDITNIRYVVEAKPVGTIAWVNGIAKLKASEED